MQTIPDVFILAGPHFDESTVVVCLAELRRQGITAVLVSITSGLLSGKRGITLRPDLTLGQITDLVIQERQMVIIAGGGESAAAVLTDPRAHHLLQQVLTAGGALVALRHTCQFIEELGLDDGRLLRQGGEDTAVFMQKLINIQLQN